MKYVKTILAGIVAGLFIGFGGAANVACSANGVPWLGAILFSCGLLSVCAFQAKLFTGKIGFIIHATKDELIDLPLMLLGNIIGAVACGYLLFLAVPQSMLDVATSIATKRAAEAFYVPLIMSIFCGMLVYLAVFGWKVIENPVVKTILLTLCVSVFVICGMQHCIANMFYYSLANSWSGETVLNVVICTLGNSAGAILLDLMIGIYKKEEEKKKD